jgi:cysteinyl-tRNA synthetase
MPAHTSGKSGSQDLGQDSVRGLTLYNSLSRTKERFAPLDPSHVKLYACGPTVYSYAHIGNARMAVVFDVLARVLKAQYPKVTYVSNITDVDDKIMQAAQESGEAIDTITEKYARIYNEDMAALGCTPPDVQPRATAHIAQMIALIERLIARDHAYASDGHVLFHVPSFPAYGGLSGRSRDEQIAGARVEIATYKKDPADFVLWKPSSAEEPGWDSPWGRGRPGWHIECSAMAEAHLGLPFDIHGGGADLKFPHHENEIAQSCCAHGHVHDLSAFAKVWVHNGFVTVEGEKMSKSLGNVMLVHDLLERYSGEALRFALLSAHYRQPLDLSPTKLEESKRVMEWYYRVLKDLEDIDITDDAASSETSGSDSNIAELLEPLLDDLNTPKFFVALNALAKRTHKERTPALKKALLDAGSSIGLFGQDPDRYLGLDGAAHFDAGDQAKIEQLIAERVQAKKGKDFARADAIRAELAAMGIEITDTPDGTIWRKV